MTIATIAPSASREDFGLAIAFAASAFPCFAFAWDGLVRRTLLIHSFPLAASLGQDAAKVRRMWAVIVGIVAALLCTVCVLLALSGLQLAVEAYCSARMSTACFGTLASTVEFPMWAWAGGMLSWFVFIWLRSGNPLKRMLVEGVWYHQERLARLVRQELQAQHLPDIPSDRIYSLEDATLQRLRYYGWIGTPRTRPRAAPWDHKQHIPSNLTPPEMIDMLMKESTFQGLSRSERGAVEVLVTYYVERAEGAKHISPLKRWWVSAAQDTKLRVYGRRAL